ncbi:hypothetical protein AVEN_55541-1 [Araneus ventricosus]|uniref:Uncharacterized protein n=1 Tax=Araneus ventricosus TaxID=182803 RepID=A0A4Y2CCH7_ARAVE|nr:hypothetical protein AVEN_55541-1 [Araneus ventricosus]
MRVYLGHPSITEVKNHVAQQSITKERIGLLPWKHSIKGRKPTSPFQGLSEGYPPTGPEPKTKHRRDVDRRLLTPVPNITL